MRKREKIRKKEREEANGDQKKERRLKKIRKNRKEVGRDQKIATDDENDFPKPLHNHVASDYNLRKIKTNIF